MTNKLAKRFFSSPTIKVARNLLGTKLETNLNGEKTSGIIVEVEAYRGDTDRACHCYYKRTPRNEIMFGEAGLCYVYFIYGNHYCVNVVTEKKDFGAAVLIRAVEPLEGIDLMKIRRNFKGGKIYNLTNGPGKLCQALGIDKKLLAEHFQRSEKIRITKGIEIKENLIRATTRIGISKSKGLPWRFYLKGSPWVSKI